MNHLGAVVKLGPFMYTIENLTLHSNNNGKIEFYSATLCGNDDAKEVTLSHSGMIFSAYESKTGVIYDLSLAPNIHSLQELKNGDNVEIFVTIPPVIKL